MCACWEGGWSQEPDYACVLVGASLYRMALRSCPHSGHTPSDTGARGHSLDSFSCITQQVKVTSQCRRQGVHVLGGFVALSFNSYGHSTYELSSSLECFDPATGAWEAADSMWGPLDITVLVCVLRQHPRRPRTYTRTNGLGAIPAQIQILGNKNMFAIQVDLNGKLFVSPPCPPGYFVTHTRKGACW